MVLNKSASGSNCSLLFGRLDKLSGLYDRSGTHLDPSQLTPAQRSYLSTSDQLIEELQAADTIGRMEPSTHKGFSAAHDPAEVPEIQKLFTIRKKDIELLSIVLPEFLKLYQKDRQGRLIDEYEPLRMAIQLYGEAYSISYWKARHILWWSAIEALFGNPETSSMARIYAMFGNHDLVKGFHRSIYDDGDIPSCYPYSAHSDHKLGEMVPLIYDVRNFAAHGQKVPDSHFSPVAHPFGTAVVGVDALAEAATFIIRKTVIAVLQHGFREKFTDRDARDDFWLYEYGLDKKQSKKRLRNMKDTLRLP
jgi:hypothetical protein